MSILNVSEVVTKLNSDGFVKIEKFFNEEEVRELNGILAKLDSTSDYLIKKDSVGIKKYDFEDTRLNGKINEMFVNVKPVIEKCIDDYGIDEMNFIMPRKIEKNVSTYLHHDNIGSCLRFWFYFNDVKEGNSTLFFKRSRNPNSGVRKIIDFFERTRIRHYLNRGFFHYFLSLRDNLIQKFFKKDRVVFRANAGDLIIWDANFIHSAYIQNKFLKQGYTDNRKIFNLTFTSNSYSKKLYDKGMRIVYFSGAQISFDQQYEFSKHLNTITPIIYTEKVTERA